jgi:HD-like signal output (HDOD) protein
MTIDRTTTTHAARHGVPVVITTHTLPPETESEIEQVLAVFLNELGQSGLFEHLSYCLRELTGNAKKANTKRVYFAEKGLDLTDPAQYERGMKTFKMDTLSDIDRYLAEQEKQNLYIRIGFLIRDHTFYLSVRNAASIMPRELTRVYDRIARSRAFDSMEEAFEEVLDDSEGAGLGITILILMLRKMGLNERAFDLTQSGSDTVVSVTVPMESVKLSQVTQIAEEVVQAVDSLPPFPEILRELTRLLADPEVPMATLASQLAKDPALTSDLIKYLNAARWGRRPPIADLEEAVRVVGILGLQELIYPYGAHKILAPYLKGQQHLQEDAARTSAYSVELAKLVKLDRRTEALVQIGGLLSNLGQIILSYLRPAQSQRILDFCRDKEFSVDLFESLTQAINPSNVAGRIAEKWGFPPDLVELLRYQDQPSSAQIRLQPAAAVVHLAWSLVSVERGLLHYQQISPALAASLRLSMSPESLHGRLKAAYSPSP